MIHFPTFVVNAAGKFGLEWFRKKFLRPRELREEIDKLKAQLDTRTAFDQLLGGMVYRDGAYWGKDGSGPFCKVCLLKDHIQMPMDEGATRGVYACPIDQSSYWTEDYRARRRSSRPRFRSWQKQRAYLESYRTR
jgi:hypothetical protein